MMISSPVVRVLVLFGCFCAADASSLRTSPSLRRLLQPAAGPVLKPSEQRLSKRFLETDCTSQYNESSDITDVTDAGESIPFPFTNLPIAAEDVTIIVSTRGDLSARNNFYTLSEDITSFGQYGRWGTHEQCGMNFTVEEYVVALETFNAVVALSGDSFTFEMTPTSSIDLGNTVCDLGENQVKIQLMFKYCELASSEPSLSPSFEPTSVPSTKPTNEPTSAPSSSPSKSLEPSFMPSTMPSMKPSMLPSLTPSQGPSLMPSTSSMPTCTFVEASSSSGLTSLSERNLVTNYTFTKLQKSDTAVEFSVSLRADLSGGLKFFKLAGNLLRLGEPGRYGGMDCSSEMVTQTYSLSGPVFNEALRDGTLALFMTPTYFIDPLSNCPNSEASIVLSYKYCELPSSVPTFTPTFEPTSMPSTKPSDEPSSIPSYVPTMSSKPSSMPSFKPSMKPSVEPSDKPSTSPSSMPSTSSSPSCFMGEYTDISEIINTGDAQDLSFYFKDLPAAEEDPVLSVFFRGGTSRFNYYTLEASQVLISSPGRFGDPGQCGESFTQLDGNLALDIFNDIVKESEEIFFDVFPFQYINSTCGGGDDQIQVQLTYKFCELPSSAPSLAPSISAEPSTRYAPSSIPSLSSKPTSQPSAEPTSAPSYKPTEGPSSEPSTRPSTKPSIYASSEPTISQRPSSDPSSIPSDMPSFVPSPQPSSEPSSIPSSIPSDAPSLVPTLAF